MGRGWVSLREAFLGLVPGNRKATHFRGSGLETNRYPAPSLSPKDEPVQARWASANVWGPFANVRIEARNKAKVLEKPKSANVHSWGRP